MVLRAGVESWEANRNMQVAQHIRNTMYFLMAREFDRVDAAVDDRPEDPMSE